VTLRIKDRSHAKKLQISLELSRHDSLGKVEPFGAGSGFFLECRRLALMLTRFHSVKDMISSVIAQSNYEK
jgi:hypothetical protein